MRPPPPSCAGVMFFLSIAIVPNALSLPLPSGPDFDVARPSIPFPHAVHRTSPRSLVSEASFSGISPNADLQPGSESDAEHLSHSTLSPSEAATTTVAIARDLMSNGPGSPSATALPEDSCPMATVMSTKGLTTYGFPVVIALQVATFVVLVGFVIYFFVWRWNFRRVNRLGTSTIRTTSATRSRLSISVPPPENTLKHMPSTQTLKTISEDPFPYTPTQHNTLSYARPLSPSPPQYSPITRVALPESPARSSHLPLSPNRKFCFLNV